jgi:hypothetical protein
MAESATPRAHRTRRPDLFTTAFLLLTTVFGAWAFGLFVLTLLAITTPAFLYSDQKALVKAAGATVVAVLALTQVFTMETAMGTLPRGRLPMRLLMRTHRWSGRIALLLAAAIAYFCLTDLGAPQMPLRAAIHGFFGATAFTVVAIKLALIRFRPQLAYNVAPWLGRYVAFAFVMIWVTSALAYFTHNL